MMTHSTSNDVTGENLDASSAMGESDFMNFIFPFSSSTSEKNADFRHIRLIYLCFLGFFHIFNRLIQCGKNIFWPKNRVIIFLILLCKCRCNSTLSGILFCDRGLKIRANSEQFMRNK